MFRHHLQTFFGFLLLSQHAAAMESGVNFDQMEAKVNELILQVNQGSLVDCNWDDLEKIQYECNFLKLCVALYKSQPQKIYNLIIKAFDSKEPYKIKLALKITKEIIKYCEDNQLEFDIKILQNENLSECARTNNIVRSSLRKTMLLLPKIYKYQTIRREIIISYGKSNGSRRTPAEENA